MNNEYPMNIGHQKCQLKIIKWLYEQTLDEELTWQFCGEDSFRCITDLGKFILCRTNIQNFSDVKISYLYLVYGQDEDSWGSNKDVRLSFPHNHLLDDLYWMIRNELKNEELGYLEKYKMEIYVITGAKDAH